MRSSMPGRLIALLCTMTVPLSAMAQTNDYMVPLGAPGSQEARMRTLNEVEPRQIISRLPYAITNPGSYSIVMPLFGVVGSNGITISASSVKLDLNGFPLTGVSNSLDGIRIEPMNDNIVVRNGVVRNWGGFGVVATNTKDVVLSDLKSYGNGYGGLYAGMNALIERCGAYNNGGLAPGVDPPWTDGIQAHEYSSVNECKAMYNKGAGIHMYNHGRVTGCTATESWDANGIWAEDYCTVKDCTAARNGSHGIRIGNMSRAVGNTSAENGQKTGPPGAGILVEGWNNLVEENNVFANDNGIEVVAGGNLIIRNTASKNTNIMDYKIMQIPPFTNNYVGPVVMPMMGGEFTNNNPWTNFRFQ